MSRPLRRTDLGDGRAGRVVFSQVREDPSVDVAHVRPGGDDHVVVVTSAGCTALGMLAAGAGRVTAVDSNHAQNDLADAITAALTAFDHPTMLRFVGAGVATGAERRAHYRELRPLLTEAARTRWDAHPRLIARGLVHAGLTEQASVPIVALIRHAVQRPSTVAALLAADDPLTQRDVFDRDWDNRRWRAMFAVALNRYTCRPLYRGFFDNVDATKFSEAFRGGIDHALRGVPIAENWYVHDLFEGHYRAECLPPHLRIAAQATIAANRHRMRLVDGSVGALLRTLPDGDVNGFCLSNVGEWLPAEQFAALLREVVRTAAPDAIVVFRNFVPRDDVIPRALRDALRPVAPGNLAVVTDRSLVRYQTVVSRVVK
ncbi:MAG: BtaA family protein [Actinomycetota bacterium]|nr:BtaA family protein [Actinomycetota bacterium]